MKYLWITMILFISSIASSGDFIIHTDAVRPSEIRNAYIALGHARADADLAYSTDLGRPALTRQRLLDKKKALEKKGRNRNKKKIDACETLLKIFAEQEYH